ncbi:MAG: molybdopterin-dependent oxidoreductase [Thaumarchaeota archaeon]|nr:molybdopterin-dependent oxidoreductase [Nitrososphaerota archaeon]
MAQLTRRSFVKTAGAVTVVGAASLKLLGADDLFIETLKPVLPRASGKPEITEEIVHTTCWIGKQDCSILAHVVNGRVVKLEGDPDNPRNKGRLCPKGQAQIISFYDPYRVKAPLRRVNGKGVPGEWVETSWDEALTLVSDKVKEVRAKDKRLLVWQKGRSKAEPFYDNAFVPASGATKLHHGAFCSDAGYRANEYTIGFNGVLHPDFNHCKYLLNWGWNIVNAGGNKLCWITFNQQLLDARGRGMKVVTLDPWKRGAGPHTDEWLPNKPGSDLAFFLTLSNVLIERGYVDVDYLKKYTNSPYLIKSDGYLLKVDGKEQVWDTVSSSAKPFDAAGVNPALEGEYSVGNEKVKPAFQAFKEHIAQYTPEWAEDICGLPAERIRKVGEELGQNAMIGSKIVLDGVELPYRPVGIAAYHVTQQELGFQACRAAIMAFMLLGAIEAVGGLRSDFGRKTHGNFKSLDEVQIKDPPYNIWLQNSKYFPINSNNSSLVARVSQDPGKYGVDYTPEVLMIHMSNPLLSFADQKALMEWLGKFKFTVVIDPWMSETADYYADVVLPAATIEKYEGPSSVNDGYNDGSVIRTPPMRPQFQSRADIDIYIDLCERAGFLYGKDGYIDKLNGSLGLKDPYKMDLDKKPDARDIFDRWAKSSGIGEGVKYFENKTVANPKKFAIKDLYAPAWNPPYGGLRHRLYGESLKRYGEVMKEKGTPENFRRDYTPFPTWRSPTMDSSPSEYDLYLISHKKIMFKQSRSTSNPLLKELEPNQYLEMNPKAAEARGINDGDEIVVESQNAITKETRQVKVKVQYAEGIRPDTVSMSHHYGHWVNPNVKEVGPAPNTLFFSGEGYVQMTADQSFQVKVRVTKA